MKKHLCLLLLFSIIQHSIGQGTFKLPPGISKEKISVEIINNLILVPVFVNGEELKFLLDTGADATLIFKLKKEDDTTFNTVINGAGNGTPTQAIRSINNTISIGNAESNDEPLFTVYDENIDLSAQLGTVVHGIIGYQLFKDFIIEFNYIKKHITLYDPETYRYKNCRKCVSFDLDIQNHKAFIDVEMSIRSEPIPIKLLLDSGLGDGVWLFEKTNELLRVPKKHYNDLLGLGLNGSIYGNRALSNYIKLDSFTLSDVITAYPDSTSTSNITNKKSRNGSLGAEVFKRFHSVVDYTNGRLTLSKNKSYRAPFYYNKSGLTFQQNTDIINAVSITYTNPGDFTVRGGRIIISPVGKSETNYKRILRKTYKIIAVRPGSPAAIAGLQENDLIISINGSPVRKLSLKNVNDFFFQKEGEEISLFVERNGQEFTYIFYLEDTL